MATPALILLIAPLIATTSPSSTMIRTNSAGPRKMRVISCGCVETHHATTADSATPVAIHA